MSSKGMLVVHRDAVKDLDTKKCLKLSDHPSFQDAWMRATFRRAWQEATGKYLVSVAIDFFKRHMRERHPEECLVRRGNPTAGLVASDHPGASIFLQVYCEQRAIPILQGCDNRVTALMNEKPRLRSTWLNTKRIR
jgi:hypothetical protein